MAVQQLPRQAAGAYRRFGIETTGGVRQNGVALRWQHLEDIRLAGGLADVGAAHGNGDDLGAASLDGAACLLHVSVLTGSDQQA